MVSLDPSLVVLAFSGDDSLVLVTRWPVQKYVPSQVEIIDWRSKRVVWRYSGPGTLSSFIARPGGRDFAIGLLDYRATNNAEAIMGLQTALDDVMIIHADGSSTAIPGRYFTAW
jgi:hypothetical protein